MAGEIVPTTQLVSLGDAKQHFPTLDSLWNDCVSMKQLEDALLANTDLASRRYAKSVIYHYINHRSAVNKLRETTNLN